MEDERYSGIKCIVQQKINFYQALAELVSLGIYWNQRVECYDPREYREQGGHDVGDNSQCWRDCEIVDIRFDVIQTSMDPDIPPRYYAVLIDVKFTHDGYISKSHFLESLRTKKK